tara:strand:- start:28 stop:723 length:696 start_codon:yes stop_codon:yes gene_type:complete
MNDITPASIGHNQPPCPIEALLAEWGGTITEAQNWADGEPVTDEAGMQAVDAVLKEFKTYRTALTKAAKERTDPLHKVWKAEVAAVKVYTDDADLMQKALIATVGPFKEKLAAQKAEAERLAWEETNRLRREAEDKAAQASASDIDAQREASEAKQAVIDAENAAKQVAKTAPKGMRKVTRYETTDRKAALHDIAANHRDAMTAFIDQFIAANHKKFTIAGVRVWEEKEAY